MKKLHLLIIQGELPNYRKSLFNYLSKFYDVTILHSGRTAACQEDSFNEIIVNNIRVNGINLQPRIIIELLKSKHDVVISMFDLRWPFCYAPLLINRNKKFFLWGHRYGKNYFINKIRTLLISLSDGVILYTEEDVARLIHNGIRAEKIFVAYNTVDVPNYFDSSSFEKKSLIYVGRTQKRKRIDLLLKAFSEVLDRIPKNVTVTIVGSGLENEKLKSYANKLLIKDRVHFFEETWDQELLFKLFSESFAYVSPGHVGLGVLHSFGYGVPVITSAKGDHAQEFYELNNGLNSLLYDNFEHFKDLLVLICTDAQLSNKLGRNAFSHYSHCRKISDMANGFLFAIEN